MQPQQIVIMPFKTKYQTNKIESFSKGHNLPVNDLATTYRLDKKGPKIRNTLLYQRKPNPSWQKSHFKTQGRYITEMKMRKSMYRPYIKPEDKRENIILSKDELLRSEQQFRYRKENIKQKQAEQNYRRQTEDNYQKQISKDSQQKGEESRRTQQKLHEHMLQSEYSPERRHVNTRLSGNHQMAQKARMKIYVTKRNKSLRFWDKQPKQTKIVDSVKNIINYITNKRGCNCQYPCPIAQKWLQWAQQHPSKLVSQDYQALKRETEIIQRQNEPGILRRVFEQISKDMPRTHADTFQFHNEIYLKRCASILKCYALTDSQVLYVQGMNMIVAGLVYHSIDQQGAFRVFCSIMATIRTVFLADFYQIVNVHGPNLNALCENNINDLWKHFAKHQINLQNVTFGWMLTIMTCLVPLDYSHQLYSGFMQDGWTFTIKMVLAMLLYQQETVLKCEQQGLILEALSSSRISTDKDINWQELTAFAWNLKI